MRVPALIGAIALVAGCSSAPDVEPLVGAEPAPHPATVVPEPAPVTDDPVIGAAGGKPVHASYVLSVLRRRIDAGNLDTTDADALRVASEQAAAAVVAEILISNRAAAGLSEEVLAKQRDGYRLAFIEIYGEGDAAAADRRLREERYLGLDAMATRERDRRLVHEYVRRETGTGEVEEATVRRVYRRSPLLYGGDYEAARPGIESTLASHRYSRVLSRATREVLQTGEYTPIDEMARRALALLN